MMATLFVVGLATAYVVLQKCEEHLRRNWYAVRHKASGVQPVLRVISGGRSRQDN